MKRLAMQRLQLDRPTEATRRPTQLGGACPCSGCQGKISVYSTIVNAAAGVRVRYLACDICNHKPADNKRIVPLEHAPPRSARSSIRPA